ncbi:hypothetical protein N7512_007703 [Penicillium capsulatum]|nr:hypothetical protein N7512_007703 [Penicillium capsulatum]
MTDSNAHPQVPLYPGEVLDTVAGFPMIYHHQPAHPSDSPSAPKPLMVCVPGSMHLARVFYGGHDGSRPDDFLAYWLSQRGFGVLSLSYPLESNPAIMPSIASRFRVSDWGRQAAEATAGVIEQYPSRSIVLISWSMGGRVVVPFTVAAKGLGMDIQQYISFAATPGISNMRSVPRGIQCSSVGYFSAPSRIEEVFTKQLDEMERSNGGRIIIPRDIYRREYIGGIPISLTGFCLKYDGQGAFIRDEVPHEEESRVFDVLNLPLISAIYPTSILDASHALSDRATWGFLMTRKLESMIRVQDIEGGKVVSDPGFGSPRSV